MPVVLPRDAEAIDAVIESVADSVRESQAAAYDVVRDEILARGLMMHGGSAIKALAGGEDEDDEEHGKKKKNPDYDVFVRGSGRSPGASDLDKIMFDMRARLMKNGFKSWFTPAFHPGTKKLWAVPKGMNPKHDKGYPSVLDATAVPRPEYDAMSSLSATEAKHNKSGILCVPSAYLKKSIHEEFSRPTGNVRRWRKLYPRLNALYDKFPSVAGRGQAKPFRDAYASAQSRDDERAAALRIARENGLVLVGHEAVRRITRRSYRGLPVPLVPVEIFSDDMDAVNKIFSSAGYRVSMSENPANIVMPAKTMDVRTPSGRTVCRVFGVIDCTGYNEASDGARVGTVDIVLGFLYGCYVADAKNRKYHAAMIDGLVDHSSRSSNRGLNKRFGVPCDGV